MTTLKTIKDAAPKFDWQSAEPPLLPEIPESVFIPEIAARLDFQNFLKDYSGVNLMVVINDADRGTPSHLLFKLLEVWCRQSQKSLRYEVLVAGGSHPWSEEERESYYADLSIKCGRLLPAFVWNEPRKPSEYEKIGIYSFHHNLANKNPIITLSN